MNNSVDDVVECPLCMEPFEVDDLNFYPCTCGYQICRFCWHRIRTDENELCPACRKEYPENPADFKPLTQEEMVAFKSQKRQRDHQRKQKITENRKHLANVRVVQKNLVFVVGLPPRLADADILKKHEYFGKYGKIHKVVINPSTTYAGVQGPSASAYVTYVHNTDALRAIQSVNNIIIDGRVIKTSLGTTKYCSHFMKNQQCPKADCMYLHELGDPEASFTKEEMHQGKHQEYEKRLHDYLIATSGASAAGGIVSTGSTSSLSSNCKITDNSKLSAIRTSTSSSTITSSLTSTTNNTPSSLVSTTGQQKEAWPSLSISPVNQKDSLVNAGVTINKCKKERLKQDKNKNVKTKKNNTSINNINLITLSKELSDFTAEDAVSTLTMEIDTSSNNFIVEQTAKSKADKGKEKKQNSLSNRMNQRKEEVSFIFKENEIQVLSTTSILGLENINEPSPNKIKNDHCTKSDSQRSLSSSSNSSSSCLMATNDNNSPITESGSGKTSPNSLYENSLLDDRTKSPMKSKKTLSPSFELENIRDHDIENTILSESSSKSYEYLEKNVTSDKNLIQTSPQNYNGNMEMASCNAEDNHRLTTNNLEEVILSDISVGENTNEKILADTLSKLNLFDENSFFSSTNGVLQQSVQMKNKHNEETIPNQLNTGTMPNLPDLINGIDGYQNSANDWEDAFKNVMLKTNKEMEERSKQHSLQQQQQLHHHNQIKHQEDWHRIQEMQKRNTLLTSLNLSQLNGTQNDYLSSNYLTGSELNRQSNFLQHQQHQLLQHQPSQTPNENLLQNTLFGTNMSKFFDFHKNQQQKQQQHCTQNVGGLNDNLHMMSLLDNNRLNPQLMDPNGTLSSQQQHQKLKIFGKMHWHQQLQQPQPQAQSSAQPQQNQFIQNSNSDDDLGFDPFIETQKALAELMENEEEQQYVGSASTSKPIPRKQSNNQQLPHQHQVMDNMQRTRMPPPGFNHVNNFGGYDIPRLQSNSKIMPFMNLPSNYGTNGQPIQQQQFQIQSNAWNTHLGNFHQHSNDQQIRQGNSNQMQNGANQKGYSGNDWTAMDPAILSFRQFSFPQQTQIAPHLQPQQQDIFLQQLAQQQQQSGLNSQAQHISGGNVGIPNAMINSQQNSQAHVNANVQGMLEYLKTRQFV